MLQPPAFSSLISGFNNPIPSIATGGGGGVGGSGGRDRSTTDARAGGGQGGNPGVTNNYYSLAAQDFARATERIINAPNAEARAVGLP